MARDFRASNIRVNKIIASGSEAHNPRGDAQLLIYPVVSASDSVGTIPGTSQATSLTASIGNDVFLFVSGSTNKHSQPMDMYKSVFGGGVLVSGSLDLRDSLTIKADDGGKIILQTSDTTVETNGTLGKIEFQAPDEASGTDAILVSAAIEAVAESEFTASANATKMVFKTAASAAAAETAVLDSVGNFTINGDLRVKGGDILGPIDSGLDIKSDGNIGLHLDDDNDGTNNFKIYNGANSPIFTVMEATGDCTVVGNLTVEGTTTTIQSTVKTVADPLMVLGQGNAGTTKDLGVVLVRGSANNMGMIFDESDDTFKVADIGSEDGTTAGNISSVTPTNFQAGLTTVSKLQIDGANDYLDVDTDLKIVSAADVLIDPTGGELRVDGNVVPNSDSADSLGASGTAWSNLYVDNIDLNGQGSISMGGTGRIDLDADDDTSIRASADDVITFEVAGADEIEMSTNLLAPAASDGAALGSGTKMWSDLFIATGGVINFGNGNMTVTHSTELLSFVGGPVKVPKLEIASSADSLSIEGGDLEFKAAADIVLDPGGNNVKPGSDNADALGVAGTAWADLFLGDGAVINFNNGDVTATHSSNLLTLAGGTLTATLTNALTHGTGISTLSYNASAGATVGIDNSVVATISGSTFTGGVTFNAGTMHAPGQKVSWGSSVGQEIFIQGDLANKKLTIDGDNAVEIAADSSIQMYLQGALVLSASTTEVVVNQAGATGPDFRVETNNLTHALFVDAGEDNVQITNPKWTLTAADIDVANDSIAIIDANDSDMTRKESVVDVATAMAGDGLVAASGVFAVNVDDATIETNSDEIRIKNSGVTLAKLANLANLQVIANVTGGRATTAGVTILDEDNMSSNSATSLATQQSIKAYVDGQVAGMDVKQSVLVATTASFTMASTASTSTLVLADGEGGWDAGNNRIIIDGITIQANGQRILIKDGVNSNGSGVHNKWNGVYTTGAMNGANLTLTRALDFDVASEFIGAPFFLVERGNENGAHGFVSEISSVPTIGTDALTFYQFSAPGQSSVAGVGLKKSGNVLSVDLNEAAAGAVTVATDSIVIIDADDSNVTKKESVLDFVAAATGTGLVAASGVISLDYAGADSFIKAAADGTGITVDSSNDKLVIYDNDANAVKYVNAGQVGKDFTAGDGLDVTGGGEFSLDLKSDGGLGTATGELILTVNTLPGVNNLAPNNDSIVIADNSDSNATKKILVREFLQGVTGSNQGLGLHSTQTLVVTGSAIPAGTLNVATDSVTFIRAGHGDFKQESIVDLTAAMAGDGLTAASGVLKLDVSDIAGNGLIDDGAENLKLDLNSLAAAAVDAGADSIAIIDAGDNSSKKESIVDLAAAMVGTNVGLNASGGQFSVMYGTANNIITDAPSGTGITVDSVNDKVLLYDNDTTQVKFVNVSQIGGGLPVSGSMAGLALTGSIPEYPHFPDNRIVPLKIEVPAAHAAPNGMQIELTDLKKYAGSAEAFTKLQLRSGDNKAYINKYPQSRIQKLFNNQVDLSAGLLLSQEDQGDMIFAAAGSGSINLIGLSAGMSPQASYAHMSTIGTDPTINFFGQENAMPGVDASFYVSGTIDSAKKNLRGSAVFNADLVLSGAQYFEEMGTPPVNPADGTAVMFAKDDGAGVTKLYVKYESGPDTLIGGGGSVAGANKEIQFNDGGSAVGAEGNFTFDKASNELGVPNIVLDEYIKHAGDTDTFLRFETNKVRLTAGNVEGFRVQNDGSARVDVNNGQADIDFRVRTAGKGHAFFVDAGSNQVGFGKGSGFAPDTFLHVSGTIGAKKIGNNKGTAVFGGDFVVSGSTHNEGAVFISTPPALTGTVNVLDNDYLVNINVTGGVATVNLPPAAANKGRVLIISDQNANSNTHNISVDPNASETINGIATYTMNIDGLVITILCDGNGWTVLSTNQ